MLQTDNVCVPIATLVIQMESVTRSQTELEPTGKSRNEAIRTQRLGRYAVAIRKRGQPMRLSSYKLVATPRIKQPLAIIILRMI
jgi:hypothetical protein